MKILQVVPSYKPAYIYGGPIESVSKLCEELTAAGNIVDVYTTTANGAIELEAEPNKTVTVDGVPVTYFRRITKDHTHISPSLWKALYKNCNNYDVVHIQSWWSPLVIVAAIICHIKKVKVVISPRGMLSDYILTATNKKVKQFVYFIAGKRALRKSYFHATSPSEYEECKKLIPGWKGFMIPNIVTLPEVTIQKKSNETFTLLFLSRIHPKKGIEFLLEAISQITEPVLLKIAGSGDDIYLNELKQKTKVLAIEDKVEWIGWRDRQEKFDELMKADLFVLISYNENFANVVIEALYMGTAVLVSNQIGLSPFVEREQAGWVTSLNTADVAKKIMDAKKDETKRKRVVEKGRTLIERFFSGKKIIADYVTEYSKIIKADSI